ncbi:caltractin [Monomorium pharaonis]|uniref:caltractin n=1 Tax=Monomorium pharaonis TaxID=307658 RepID=UPI00063FB7B8|nr:caltractin [Monomorium pharaonis]XP_036146185.1 caltractin [Monomorium pharaonis]XP_036146186.1 caltractin [Monomorium pharaonis]XP_036146187.1 caltractin [Monomorium pharaonis]
MASTSKKQNARKKIKVELTERQKANIKEAFDLFDPDGTGKIAVKDLKVALRAMGFEPTQKEIQALLEDTVPIHPNHLSYEEFMKVMLIKMSEEEGQDEILRAFRLFDDDKTGKISFENLKRVANELEENLTDEEILDMINQVDEDGDGQISLEEFMKLFKNMSSCS